MSDLTSKDDVVREMQANLDHMNHQLDIALNDRHLLLEQLHTLAGMDSVNGSGLLGGGGGHLDLIHKRVHKRVQPTAEAAAHTSRYAISVRHGTLCANECN